MARREALRRAGVSLAPSKGNGTGKLPLAYLNVATGRPGRPPKNLNISIALIDPKPLTRRSIAEMLAKALPNYVTLTAASCQELLALRSRLTGSPHLIIVYIRSAGVTDAFVQEALELVRLRLPDARVIVLSDRDDVQNINEALSCGVRGYIPTSVEAEVAFAALTLIRAGGTYIPAHQRHSATGKPDMGVEGDRRGIPVELDLTPRELSVLDLLREGKPNKLIAAGLNMEEGTVKVHVRNILKKLRAANRTEAASVANRLLGEHAPVTVRLRQSTQLPGPIQSPGTPNR